MTGYSESALEHDVLEVLAELGWEPKEGKEITVGSGERESWDELIIPARLRDAVAQINPELPPAAVDEVVDLVLRPKSRSVEAENFRIHQYLTQGIRDVSYVDEFGVEQHPTVYLIDFTEPYDNDFLAVRQVTVVKQDERRRFDAVLYVNGLPLAIFELKKMTDENATAEVAHAQLMAYVDDMWQAFRCNVVSLVSDGMNARYGTAFTPYNHFAPWNVDDDGEPVPQPAASWSEMELSLTLYGLFEQRRFIEVLKSYVAFAQADGGPAKRIAKPHQYFAVSRAILKTIEAVRSNGKAGVVWHTQGSGKSFEMELYSNQVLKHPALGNPTIVVITDRTDLDDQLFESFNASELLPEKPVRVTSREGLRTGLSNRRTGGIYFTTLQKFGRTQAERDAGLSHPLLSDRRNIIVIVDEAHRSHYDDLNGYARHLRQALPYATMIAFTGTPLSEADRDTQAVFGGYIDIYDLTRAVEDGATVSVYYENRYIDVELPRNVDPETLDEEADRVTEGLDDAERKRAESASVTLNAIYGAPARIEKLAADIVAHWQARSEAMKEFIGVPGKAMIVCSTREICAAVYRQIIDIKRDWHSDDVNTGKIKVVYSSDQKDPKELRAHRMRPSEHKTVQRRMKDPDDELELIIVKDMLLTGFDAPPLHTLYLDRSMRGAQLMQTLARVNRTFRNKQDGLMVGYAPLHENLLRALAEYTTTDQQTKPMGRDLEDALGKVRDIIEVLGNMLDGYPWRESLQAKSPTAYRDTILGAANHVWDDRHPLNQVEENPETGERDPTLKERFLREASRLARFYALCRTSGELNDLRDDIAFFRDVRVMVVKLDANRRQAEGRPIPADVELYLKQLTAGAIEAGDVTDLFAAAGLQRPDLSHLDDTFIEKFKADRNPALAIEALRRLVQQQMRQVTKHNVVRQQSFSDQLLDLMRRYANQHITAAQVLAELFDLAKEVANDANRGQEFTPALTNDELAFYDAVAAKETVRNLMGDNKLADIARDLVHAVRRNLSTDWTARDDVQARLRSIIKRLLAKHGYPPEEEKDAIDKVIQQLETFADEWSPNSDD
ncbi:type I restriction endonuclease subunit R [Actinomadura sp. 6N118]|uniref:type I restriction endonuclease subunit R n=1 Tax=Actinomadura sp. 6N118 TaxID=3375151 RepID=UPI00378F6657